MCGVCMSGASRKKDSNMQLDTVKCVECGAYNSLTDGRYAGKFIIKCRKCGHILMIRNTITKSGDPQILLSPGLRKKLKL